MAISFNDAPLNVDVKTKGFDDDLKKADLLDTNNYARAISEFIKDSETPITIGIQGDWGIGKTSMLNTIKSLLLKEDKENYKTSINYGVFWLNTWHYSMFGQEEYLGLAVIKGLIEDLRNKFKIQEDNSSLQDALKFSKNLIKNAQFNIAGFGFKASDGAQNDEVNYDDVSVYMRGLKESLEKLVSEILTKKNVEKLVFFIDDLDRVKPIRAVELLEVLKNFLDIPNCVFVIAVDYEVIELGMEQKIGVDLQKKSGKSFVDKIIQLPVAMPTSSYNLGKYISTLLKSSDRRYTDIDKNFYEEVTTLTVGRNPRSIKRVINYLSLIRKIGAKRVTQLNNERKSENRTQHSDDKETRKILYALICMQIAWPEVFNFFAKSPTDSTIKKIENWEEQQNIPFINKLYGRTPNVDLLKSNISAYFDLIYGVLDKDGSGHLSQSELEPIWNALYLANLIHSIEFHEPFDQFREIVKKNTDKKSIDYNKFLEALKKSKLITREDFDFKLSGSRYVTLVFKRKQVGCLVSLNKNPFIFRINLDRDTIIKYIENDLDDSMSIQYKDVIENLEDNSLTGFGDTIINFNNLLDVSESEITHLFNLIAKVIMERIK